MQAAILDNIFEIILNMSQSKKVNSNEKEKKLSPSVSSSK